MAQLKKLEFQTDVLQSLTSRTQAYEFADANGFKFKRSQMKVSIYAHKNGKTMEIAEKWCALYRARATTRERKEVRLIEVRNFA